MPHLAEAMAILDDLIAFPTVSADSNLDLILYAADRLTDCGARLNVQRDESGLKANLFATLGPEGDGGIVLSGHTDVVPADEPDWLSDPFALREEDGRLYGRGTCDMKGFLAAALALAPRFAELPLTRPVHFALTYDEEVGCLGGQQLADELARAGLRPGLAIIGEPTGMRVIEGHKGCFEYTTEFSGLEGHASLPDRGVNAIEYATRYMARMLELGAALKADPPPGSPFSPPWTTLQVGRIAGGSARNVIAAHCALDWEMRPVRRADADRVKEALRSYCDDTLLPEMRRTAPGAAIRTLTVGEVAGLEPAADNEARDIALALTGGEGTDVVSFGTEAGLFQALGVATVVCGPGSIAQAHKPNEYISLAQFQAGIDMLAGLAPHLTSGRAGA